MLDDKPKYSVTARFFRLLKNSDIKGDFSTLKVDVYGRCAIALYKGVLLCGATMRSYFPKGLEGEMFSSIDGFLLVAELNSLNAKILRKALPFLNSSPVTSKRVWSKLEDVEELKNSSDSAIFFSDNPRLKDEITFCILEHQLDIVYSIVPVQKLVKFVHSDDQVAADNMEYLTRKYVTSANCFVEFTEPILADCQNVLLKILAQKNSKNEIFIEVGDHANSLRVQCLMLFLSRQLRGKKIPPVVLMLEEGASCDLWALKYGNLFALTVEDSRCTIYDRNDVLSR